MRCTAKRRRSEEQCKKHAILGKDKCRLHGGLTPCKHGRYSKYNPLSNRFLRDASWKCKGGMKGIYAQIQFLRAMLETEAIHEKIKAMPELQKFTLGVAEVFTAMLDVAKKNELRVFDEDQLLTVEGVAKAFHIEFWDARDLLINCHPVMWEGELVYYFLPEILIELLAKSKREEIND